VPIHLRSRRAILWGVAGLLLSHARSEAHAILEDSEPKAGATIPPGPVALKLRFNSRIDRARSGLTLIRSDKADNGDSAAKQTRTALTVNPDGPPDILTATFTLTPGAYVVRWQVLAIDGHITRGDVPLTVLGN
jgi:methionine-rich copper-binding protein CopC